MAKRLRCVNCGATEYLHLLPREVLISDYPDDLMTEVPGCLNTLLSCQSFEEPRPGVVGLKNKGGTDNLTTQRVVSAARFN